MRIIYQSEREKKAFVSSIESIIEAFNDENLRQVAHGVMLQRLLDHARDGTVGARSTFDKGSDK